MEFVSEWFWFFLFLPLAALSGWVIGRRGGQRHGDNQVSRLSSTYFRGLNYLLNEQPDKAIELFLHIAELDKETFETQVALGHLFRRRGEVDRAIRLHQGLVNRADLTDAQRVQALLALGEDYMKSGLLDRAETVFTELAQLDQRAPQALKHLIGIYQAERDWEKAIDNASRFEEVTGEPMGKLIGQFECELAERFRGAGRSKRRGRPSRAPTRPMPCRSVPASLKGVWKPMPAMPKRPCARSNVPPAMIPSTCPKCCSRSCRTTARSATSAVHVRSCRR